MRLRLLLAAGVGASVALVVVVALVATRGGAASGAGVTATGYVGSVRPPGIPPARFALRDQDGRLVRASDLRGRVAALMFVYSTCTDSCPVTAQQVRGALDRLGRRATAVAISVDPAADTRAHVDRFLLEQHIAGRVPYLVGSRAQLTPVWREFGVAPEERGREHAVAVVLLDRRGRQRIGFGADDTTADGLAHDMAKLARG